MRKNFSSISEELIRLHEHIRREWPQLLRIAVALYDSETGMLHTFIKSTTEKNPLSHYSTELNSIESLLLISKSREPRLIKDLELLQQSETIHTKYILEAGFQSSFTVPLYLNNNLLGFIFYDATEIDYFSPKLQQHLEDYSRLIESLIISEILPIKSLIGIVNTTKQITQFRDEETGKHLTRMAHYVELIALELADKYNLSDENIEYMWLYAPLHDIGKIAIADNILMKPAKLNDSEYDIMKTHVVEGDKMLKMITENFDFQQLHHLDILQQIVSEHHERIDGSGYPQGLKGDEISIVGRITAVADVFDAMSSRRVYSEAIDIDEVFDYMHGIKDTQLDKDCVDALIKQKVKVVEIFNKFQDTDI